MQTLLRLLREIVAGIRILGAQQQEDLELQRRLINISRQIIRHLNRIESNMATQADIDAIKASIDTFATDLGAALDGIQGDLDALKAANPAVDLSALQASVTALAGVVTRAQDVDAENPVVPLAV